MSTHNISFQGETRTIFNLLIFSSTRLTSTAKDDINCKAISFKYKNKLFRNNKL